MFSGPVQSWLNDECEDDDAGESDEGYRYEKCFHEPNTPSDWTAGMKAPAIACRGTSRAPGP